MVSLQICLVVIGTKSWSVLFRNTKGFFFVFRKPASKLWSWIIKKNIYVSSLYICLTPIITVTILVSFMGFHEAYHLQLAVSCFLYVVCLFVCLSLLCHSFSLIIPTFSTRTIEFLVVCIFHFPVLHEVLSFHRLFVFCSRRHTAPVGQLPIILLSEWCVRSKVWKRKGSRDRLCRKYVLLNPKPTAQFNSGA